MGIFFPGEEYTEFVIECALLQSCDIWEEPGLGGEVGDLIVCDVDAVEGGVDDGTLGVGVGVGEVGEVLG